MNKLDFLEAMRRASSERDDNAIKSATIASINACSEAEPQYPRGHRNLIIAAEELSELGQQVCKLLRGKSDKADLIEELADAYLASLYIKEIGNISDEEINKAINVKIERLRNQIAETGTYQ